MDQDAAEAWNQFAADQNSRNTMTGRTRSLTGVTAFTQLTSKFLQAYPTGTIPGLPPTTAFTGDAITVTATGETDNVVFHASGANAPNVKTELLLQRLPSQNRTPTKRGYRAKAFVAFASSLTSAQSGATGWYVPAYRFVNITTGQATHVVSLPPVQIT